MKKFGKILLVLIFLTFLLGAGSASALEVNYPKIPGLETPQEFLETAAPNEIVPLYVKYFSGLLFWVSGVLAFGMLIYAGFLYLTAGGKPEKIIEARSRVIGVLVGLAVLLGSIVFLELLDPDFVDLELPELAEVNIYVPDQVELPEEPKESAIDIEMPIGRVIDSIFEIHAAHILPDSSADWIAQTQAYNARLPRITALLKELTTFEGELDQNNDGIKDPVPNEEKTGIADRLANESLKLVGLADDCDCYDHTDPDGCSFSGCGDCGPSRCVNDACAGSRDQIEQIEADNVDRLDELVAWQKKMEDEITSLKLWLSRLTRGEQFIADCSFSGLTSWGSQLNKKTFFDNRGWLIDNPGFWDDLNIVYRKLGDNKPSIDSATFYCTKGGTAEESVKIVTSPAGQPDLGKVFEGAESSENIERVLGQRMECSLEAPLGEIVDRAKRTTKLLIYKLERIVQESKNLTNHIDRKQRWVSTCSNRICIPICICITTPFKDFCIKIGCFGVACIFESKIESEARNLISAWQRLKDFVYQIQDTSLPPEVVRRPDDFGVVNIFREVVPGIKDDLETVRQRVESCVSPSWENQERLLISAGHLPINSSIPPSNRTFTQFEYIEEINNGVRTDTEYGYCFDQCYLETDFNNYRSCLSSCLEQHPDQTLKNKAPEINFYCCNL